MTTSSSRRRRLPESPHRDSSMATTSIALLTMCLAFQGTTTEAFPTVSHRTPPIIAPSFINCPGSKRRTAKCRNRSHSSLPTRLAMASPAATEDFVQMKVNGDTSDDGATAAEPDGGTADVAKESLDNLGTSALSGVQALARTVTVDSKSDLNDDDNDDDDATNAVGGEARSRLIRQQRRALDEDRNEVLRSTASDGGGVGARGGAKEEDGTLIATALQRFEKDMALLDNLASLQPQLSGTEVGLLLGAIFASGIGPIAFPDSSVTDVLAPAAAAFTASITIGSEYIGRVAVADGKEIAANAVQCFAEAEALLAKAERVKAIMPLCIGVGAACAPLALVTPAIIDALRLSQSAIAVAELHLLFPILGVLSTAVAKLSLEQSRTFARRAIRCGLRRFGGTSKVASGKKYLSYSEEILRSSQSRTDKWISFAWGILPAPILGGLLGGPTLRAKCVIVAALAAAQGAYYLACVESVIAKATAAVALKARSSAVCDTYANQGVRNSAILPFTSALSAFCAAATAATIELPFIDTVKSLYGTLGEVAVVTTFPILSSAFAAAGAVSKARCEVDAEAAAQVASTLALEYDGMDDDPLLKPFQEVCGMVRLAASSGWSGIKKGVGRIIGRSASSAGGQ